MRVLFVSKEGDGMGVAARLAAEGHTVSFYCADARFWRAGQGLVNRVREWRVSLRSSDLVIADCVGLGRYEHIIRASGKPALGFSAILDAIELNREKGIELFQKAGIKVPETHAWATPAEARRLPSKLGWGDGWVVKANGNISTAKTAVCKDEALWDRAVAALPPQSSGIIQRLVSGIEVSTECWFNGNDFIRPFNHTFEEKRFLAGGLGQNTGCMGNVVLRADSNKLTKATVERLDGFLRTIGYRGPIDINCIVNETGAHALEATSRMGYDAVEALIEGLEEPAGAFLFETATGTKQAMRLTDETMIAVRLSIPPWPMRKPDSSTAHGEPVLGLTREVMSHIFPTDIYKEGEDFFTAGGDGVLLKATAIGRSRQSDGRVDYVREARRRVYRTLSAIKVSDKQYRTDIGERVNADITQLKRWEWI